MRYPALILALMAAPAASQTDLIFIFEQSAFSAAPGESVTFTIKAELRNPTAPVLATISDMGFELSFGGTDLIIENNSFAPAFDSDFFGPADDGTVSGDSILNATGNNVLPPLNNSGGPDSSNPITIYSFDARVPLGTTQFQYALDSFSLVGQVNGAYEGQSQPFPVILTYQDALGNPGDVPWSIDNLFVGFSVIPTPSTGVFALAAGLTFSIKRRR